MRLQCFTSPSLRGLVAEPSANQAATINRRRIMGRAERIVKKHTRGRRGKKECERARGEMTATGWKTKYVSHCAIFSYFPPLLFRKYWYSVPEGTFWISTKIFQVQSEPTTHLRGGFFYTRSLIKWFGEAERSCD